jgi:transcriptional regulator with XRE-family HTH domain
MDIGQQLKKIRTDQTLTLAEVAESIGLTASSLSQIENNKMHPSIQSLEALLKYYRIPLSEFFRQMERTDFLIVRAAEVEAIRTQRGILISLLASKLRDNVLESYEIELQPESRVIVKTISDPFNGERFLSVRSGIVHCTLNRDTVALETGDSVNFKSHIPCEIRNESPAPATIFINGSSPVL